MFDTLEKPLVVTGAARELGLIRIEHRWRVADAAQTAKRRKRREWRTQPRGHVPL
jgi:hypothetical protein